MPCFLNSMDTINIIDLQLTISLEAVKGIIFNEAINYKTAPDFKEV